MTAKKNLWKFTRNRISALIGALRAARRRISLWIKLLHNCVPIEPSSPLSLCGEQHTVRYRRVTFRKQYGWGGVRIQAAEWMKRLIRRRYDFILSTQTQKEEIWKWSLQRLSREQSRHNHRNAAPLRTPPPPPRVSKDAQRRETPPLLGHKEEFFPSNERQTKSRERKMSA